MSEKEWNRGCVALIVPSGTGEREVLELVRQRLRELGVGWPAMELELWRGEGENLVLAHPAQGERVYISAFALKYLTE